MQERIRKILEYTGLNQNLFAEKLNIAPATLSNILKGKTKPSMDIVQNIRQAFPDLNTIWLLDGTGEMFLSSTSKSEEESVTPIELPTDDLFSKISQVQPAPATVYPSGNPSVHVNQKWSTTNQVNSSLPDPSIHFVENSTNHGELKMVKIIDKPFRKVKEIQVFYDDDTYEIFVPKK